MLLVIFSTLFLVSTAAKDGKHDTLSAVESTNELAFKLYPVMAKKYTSNMIYSPASIAVAFGTASLAASSKSKKELTDVMSWDSTSVHSGMKEFLDALRNNQERNKVYFANRIFADQKVTPSKTFTEKAKNYYGADLGVENFAWTSKARKYLNKWIKDESKLQVKNFLPNGVLSSRDEVVLVNAIHFKANWLKGFKGRLTKKSGAFRVDEEKKTTALMMQQENMFNYTYCDEVKAQVLELPFARQYSMYIFLPKEENEAPPNKKVPKKRRGPKGKQVPQKNNDPLEFMESKLNLESFQNCIGQASRRRIRLFLPQFKLREQIKMKNISMELGVKSLFSNSLDEMGLNEITKVGGQSIRVDEIYHQSFISIGPKGSGRTGGHHSSNRAPLVNVDHPFLFFVRDNAQKIILLVGRVNDTTPDKASKPSD